MDTRGRTDYYEVLGVDRDAPETEIKRAYRRLGRQYHPDVNRDDPSAEEKFKEISEAYAVLSNKERRAQYDQYGHAGAGNGGFGGTPIDIFDIFASAFGGDPFGFGQGTSAQASVGRDMRYDLEISLEDVLTGIDAEIEYSRHAACDVCGGTGAAPGSELITCPTCGGMGQVRSARNTFIGTISTVQTCPQCNGRGRTVEKPCTECSGNGVVRRSETLTVTVPAGVMSGNELVLRGFGEAPPGGGRTGDLYVRLYVAPHERFTRKGDDLFADLGMTVVRAAVGGKITVETLDGEAELQVPAGTQPDEEFVIRGRGLPRVNSQARGDLHLRTRVAIPRDLTPHQRELLLAFADDRGEDVSPEDPGLFERIRNVLTGH